MRDATAGRAPVELERSVAPHVNVGGPTRLYLVDLAGRVIGPQNAVASAYRAVALRDLRRRSVNLQANGTAMTRSPYHDLPIAPFLAGTE